MRAPAEQQPQQGTVNMGPQGNVYDAFESEVLFILFLLMQFTGSPSFLWEQLSVNLA